jgi:hypothetical protein
MANVSMPRGEIVVDRRGRTNLARVRSPEHQHDRYHAEEHDDGTIVLTPLLTFTPAGLEEFLADPHKTGTRRQRPDRGDGHGDSPA